MREFSYFFHVPGMGASFRMSGPVSHSEEPCWVPAADIFERDDSLVVVLELPGVDKDKIEVAVEGVLLRVSGARPKSIPDATRHVHQLEIPYGRFLRAVRLPSQTDTEAITAEYKEGYLTITIPKA